MLCTWAEQDILKPGLIYVAKAFKSEVVHVWQKHFPGSTALQLCLRVSISNLFKVNVGKSVSSFGLG